MLKKYIKSSCEKVQQAIADIFKFPRITAVAVSNDGLQVAYSTFALKAHERGKYWQYQLYLKTAGGEIISLAKTKGAIVAPQWSNDGKKLAYLVKDSIKKQTVIWIYDAKQNSAAKLLTLKQDIIAFKWSPHAKQIAFIADKTSTTLYYHALD